MAETILVGVDGSDGARRAAEYAAASAGKTGARLLLVHAIDWSRYDIYTPEELETRHRDRDAELKFARERILDPLIAEFEARGCEAEGLAHHGHAVPVLCEAAGEDGVSAVYIGRRGRSKLKDMVFGSVAGSLVQACPVPVTVVP